MPNRGVATSPRNDHGSVRVVLRPIDEHAALFPKRRRAPFVLPTGAPVPRAGEMVFLTSTSAWGVLHVVHEILAGGELCVSVWLRYLGKTPYAERPDFVPTQ